MRLCFLVGIIGENGFCFDKRLPPVLLLAEDDGVEQMRQIIIAGEELRLGFHQFAEHGQVNITEILDQFFGHIALIAPGQMSRKRA